MSLVVTSLQDFYVYKHSFVFPRDTTFNVTHSSLNLSHPNNNDPATLRYPPSFERLDDLFSSKSERHQAFNFPFVGADPEAPPAARKTSTRARKTSTLALKTPGGRRRRGRLRRSRTE